ncbi:hypothetical protein CEE37_00160 [candidate division LCP-89 bacterium B3_LCP]|uniref:EamA domain-containing protein n=1 Tax=candidate division LCP-89 bacterium B3_LCP TaxID=2012998 RepID=A0A532V4J0_UNCL8|nr:MAG: hypothetical protein CEE37_00160 [candidate division LCP-89 bacterium B3_LCP]
MSSTSKGYAFVITSTFLTGCIYTLGKAALEEITPEQLVAWIFMVAAVPLGIWSAYIGKFSELRSCSKRDWVYILAFSAFSIAALQTMWMGLQGLDPTVASFIGRLQTLVTVTLGLLFLKERFRLHEAMGGLVLIFGIVIIRISFDVALSYWFWMMVASGVFFGITEIFAKQSVRHIHPIPLNFVRNSIIAVVFTFVVLLRGQHLFDLGGVFWHVVAIGIIGPLFSRLCFLFAMRHIDISKVALLNQIQPVFVFILAFTFMGMIPSMREMAGGMLILIGALVLMGGRRVLLHSSRQNQHLKNIGK